MNAGGTPLARQGCLGMSQMPDGLVYYPDSAPGITRRRAGRGFTYTAPDGTRIEQADERKRIAALAVPPAYEDVWICPRRNGHLQATGRDARARKQYRYHPDYSAFRAQTKFDDLPRFGAVLPRLRRRIQAVLTGGQAGDAEFAIAAALRLMDRASLRVGTPDYAEDNGTYGAATLRSRHVRLDGGLIRLDYRAKGGQRVRKQLRDRTLHRALEAMDDLPGGALMVWEDGGQLTPERVNAWLRAASDEDGLTAKTFRTWSGSAAALDAVLRGADTIKAKSEAAAQVLHNTPTIARGSYIHPAVIDLQAPPPVPDGPDGLRQAERALLRLIG